MTEKQPKQSGEQALPPADQAFDSLDKAAKHLQIAEAWIFESIRHLEPSLGASTKIADSYRGASEGVAITRAHLRLIKLAQLAASPKPQP